MTDGHKVEPRWTGHDLYDKDGEKIGTIEDVRFGDLAGNLKWLVVKTGLLGGKKAYVPAGELETIDGKLVVPFGRDQVKDAPHIKEELSPLPSVEEKLCRYYGLDYVRSASDPVEGCVDSEE